MNVYDRKHFAAAARKYCPEYPEHRPSYASGEPYTPAPIPSASEANLQTVTDTWTTEINNQRIRAGHAAIGKAAVSQQVLAA